MRKCRTQINCGNLLFKRLVKFDDIKNNGNVTELKPQLIL